jgi:hypothetical protein
MDNIKLDFQATYMVRHNSAITTDTAVLLYSAVTTDTAVLLYTEHRTLIKATGISNIVFLVIDCKWYCGMQVPDTVQ